MKQLLLVFVLLYAGTKSNAQNSLVPRQIDMHLGYGLSNLLPNGFHLESSMSWDKPLGLLFGYRYAMNLNDFMNPNPTETNAYVSGWSSHIGADYRIFDEYTDHNLYVNTSVGMATYLKNLSFENMLLESEQMAVSSVFVRVGGRYQYQFGVLGVYAQPWILFGRKREIGGDIGIVIRRQTR